MTTPIIGNESTNSFLAGEKGCCSSMFDEKYPVGEIITIALSSFFT
jgi:hypothetical protein